METIFPVKFNGKLTIDQIEGFVDVCMEYAAEIKIDVTFVRGRKQCELQSNCNLPQVSSLLIAWEQYKKANWWESEAIDVEKVLMERFTAIYNC
jgi:hypothetical protein